MDDEFEKTPHSIAKRHAVDVLNLLLEKEPGFIERHLQEDMKIPVGDWVLDHPTLVPDGSPGNLTLGFVGLLNGLFCFNPDNKEEDLERISRNHHRTTGKLTGFGIHNIKKPILLGDDQDELFYSPMFLNGEFACNGAIAVWHDEMNYFANDRLRRFYLHEELGKYKEQFFNTRMIAGEVYLFPEDVKPGDQGYALKHYSECFHECDENGIAIYEFRGDTLEEYELNSGTLINNSKSCFEVIQSNKSFKPDKYRLIKLIDDCPEYHVGDLFETASIGGDIWLHKDPPEVGMSVLPIELLHHFEKVEL